MTFAASFFSWFIVAAGAYAGSLLFSLRKTYRATGIFLPMNMVVKRDPGLVPILMGNGALCLLMLWYFPIILKNRNGGNS